VDASMGAVLEGLFLILIEWSLLLLFLDFAAWEGAIDELLHLSLQLLLLLFQMLILLLWATHVLIEHLSDITVILVICPESFKLH
jgi:hypothetical protein